MGGRRGLRRRPDCRNPGPRFHRKVERNEFNGRIVGSVFTEGGARQCFIGGLMPADRNFRAGTDPRALENLRAALAPAGFELADTVRTWFFLENILSWYDDFNQARTKIYSGVKFRTGSLPASTGVGAKNPAGTALALAAWAFQPLKRMPAPKRLPRRCNVPRPPMAARSAARWKFHPRRAAGCSFPARRALRPVEKLCGPATSASRWS